MRVRDQNAHLLPLQCTGSDRSIVEPVFLPFSPNTGNLPRLMNQLFSWTLSLFSVGVSCESIQNPLRKGSSLYQFIPAWKLVVARHRLFIYFFLSSAFWETSCCYICMDYTCGSQCASTFKKNVQIFELRALTFKNVSHRHAYLRELEFFFNCNCVFEREKNIFEDRGMSVMRALKY